MGRWFRFEKIAFLPFRIAIILIGIVLILYFLLFLFLKSPSGIEFVSSKIKGIVKDATGIEIELKAIKLDIFNAELVLNNFELMGSEKKPLASLKGLRASLSLPYLIFGKIVISDFSLSGIDGEIVVQNGKILNLPRLSSKEKKEEKKSEKGTSVDITVERFSISSMNVRLKYEDLIESQIKIQEISGSYISNSAELSLGNLDANVVVKENTYSLNMNLKAAYLNNAVIIRSLDLVLDKKRVLSLVGEIKNIEDPVFNLDFVLDTSLDYLKNYPIGMKRAEGQVNVKGKFKGNINAPIVRANVLTKDVIIEGFKIGSLEGELIYDNGDIQANNLKVDNYGNRLVVNASGSLKNEIKFIGNVKIERLELAELLRNLGVNSIVMLDIKGLIDFIFKIDPSKGVVVDAKPVLSLKGPTIFSNYYFSPKRGEPVFNLKSANLSGDVSVTEKGVELRSVDVFTEKSKVLVRDSFIGFAGDGYMDLKATSQTMDFSDITPIAGLDIRGVSSLNAVLKGPFPSLRIIGDVNAHGFSFEHFYGGTVKLNVEFFDNKLSFSNISGRVNDMAYSGDVVLNMNGAPDMDVNAVIKDVSLKNVVSLLSEQIRIPYVEKGRISASVRLSGPVDKLKGEISANLSDVLFYQEKIDRVDTTLLLEEGNLTLKSLNVVLYNGRISSSGLLKEEGDIDFTIDLSNIDLGLSKNLRDLPVKFSGLFSGNAKITGRIKSPVVDFKGSISNLKTGSYNLGDLNIIASLKENMYSVHSNLTDGRIIYDLNNDSERPEIYNMKAEINNVDISKLFYDGEMVSTDGDIDANFSGNIKTGDFSGSASVKRLLASIYDMKFKIEKPFVISLLSGGISFTDIHIMGDEIDLKIDSSQFNPQNLNISGRGLVPLSLIKGLTKGTVSATGSLNLDFSLQGSIEEPNISINGAIQNSLLRLSFFPHPFENTSLKFFMQKDTINISELKGNLAGGKFDGGGSIILDGYIPSNFGIKVDINRAFLSFPKELPSIVSGYLTINGDINKLLIGGEIDVEKATYSKNVDFNTLLVELTRKKPKFTSYSRENEFVFFDIGIKAPSGILVKNNIVSDSEFKADLRLTGSNERIGIMGTVNAIRGKMILSGNEYSLKRGIVQLTEKYRISYNLDFVFSTVCHDVNSGIDHNIEMSVTGSDENIRIHYKDNTSPPFSETDIVTCLALGTTTQKTGPQDKNSQQESLGLISSVAGVDQKLKDIIPIPIETFRISSKYSDTLKMNVPQVQVSWKLMSDLRLNYSSSLIYTQDQKIELDYKLNRKTSIRTQWNSQAQVPVGNLGVDIKWNWEF